MNELQLTVVIPSYNEETNIRLGALDKVSRYMDRQRYGWEVILVDDGSSDSSPSLLDAFVSNNPGFRILHTPHRGKAATVISGMKAAKGSIIVFSDLDQATPISELAKILPYFTRGYDVVIGSRNNRREGAPASRIIMARGFMLLRSIILGLKGISDTQCGFKGFSKEAAVKIVHHLKLYDTKREAKGPMVTAGFDIELLFLANLLGYKIKEVPVEWHYVETRRVSPIKDSWQGLTDMLRIRINALNGMYR